MLTFKVGRHSWQNLIPTSIIFTWLRGELTKIWWICDVIFKNSGKELPCGKEPNIAMCFIRFICIEDQSCLLSNIVLRKTTSKISFEIISVSISFFSLVLYHSFSNINLQNSFIMANEGKIWWFSAFPISKNKIVIPSRHTTSFQRL